MQIRIKVSLRYCCYDILFQGAAIIFVLPVFCLIWYMFLWLHHKMVYRECSNPILKGYRMSDIKNSQTRMHYLAVEFILPREDTGGKKLDNSGSKRKTWAVWDPHEAVWELTVQVVIDVAATKPAVSPLVKDEVLVLVEVSIVVDVEGAGVIARQEAVFVLTPSVRAVRGTRGDQEWVYCNTLYNSQ